MNVTSFEARRDALLLHPIEPRLITEGAPTARLLTLTESSDKLLSSGIWDCTAGKFKWVYELDEIVDILEGEVTVRDLSNGQLHRLRAGDGGFFPQGAITEWHVPHYVKKFFVVRAQETGIVARLRRYAMRLRSL
ncbi:MAG: cupin domain-containing protein [Polyangiaceae bacterium]